MYQIFIKFICLLFQSILHQSIKIRNIASHFEYWKRQIIDFERCRQIYWIYYIVFRLWRTRYWRVFGHWVKNYNIGQFILWMPCIRGFQYMGCFFWQSTLIRCYSSCTGVVYVVLWQGYHLGHHFCRSFLYFISNCGLYIYCICFSLLINLRYVLQLLALAHNLYFTGLWSINTCQYLHFLLLPLRLK